MTQPLNSTQNLQSPPPSIDTHPIFTGATTVGMISGENPKFPAQTTGNEKLAEALRQMGLKSQPRKGCYDGPEDSFLVYGPTREQLYELGRKFGQESVVFSQGGKNHELLYTNGPACGRHIGYLGREWNAEQPDNYWTHFPEHGGYLTLQFDWGNHQDSKLDQPHAMDAQAVRAQHGVAAPPPQEPQQPEVSVTKAELRAALLQTLKKTLATISSESVREHPHSYAWHNGHTDHHLHHAAPGVLLVSSGLAKAEPPAPGTGHPASQVDPKEPATSSYVRFALPYGAIDPANKSSSSHYPYQGKSRDIDRLVKDHGYTTYYSGGKYGRPDLAARNYNTKHLLIQDPSIDLGEDPGDEAYTDGWRKMHELAHALTQPEVEQLYGAGKRTGDLGRHRTLREALRSVHWEWLATHKQRELSKQLGVEIPDSVFNRELNTVMHDAVHRAVTGKVSEPGKEGFRPHEHQVPLETSLGMVRESAHNLGITGMHDLIQKSEEKHMADEKVYESQEWKRLLAQGIRDRIDSYSKGLLELRQRELKKSEDHGPAPKVVLLDACPLCGCEDLPGSCKCVNGQLAKAEAHEFVARTRSPVADCKTCGKPHKHANHTQEPVLEAWETTARRNAGEKDVPSQRPNVPGVKKGELSAKAKEPVKPADGNGIKVKKLKIPGLKKDALPMTKAVAMSGMGKMGKDASAMASRDAAAAAKPAAPAAKVKLPGAASQAQRASSFGDFMPAGKFSGPGAGIPKPASTPPAGVGHLKAPPAIPGAAPKPAAGAAPVAPKPAAAGLPKPAAPMTPKAASPATAPSAKTMGKT